MSSRQVLSTVAAFALVALGGCAGQQANYVSQCESVGTGRQAAAGETEIARRMFQNATGIDCDKVLQEKQTPPHAS